MTRPNTITESMERLTRIMWWVKGCSYARPASVDEGDGSQEAIGGLAGNVREYLAGLQDGKRRTVAPGRSEQLLGNGAKIIEERHDGGLICITYGELERIIDGLPNRHRRADPADQRIAMDTVQTILREYQAEADLYVDDDRIPF